MLFSRGLAQLKKEKMVAHANSPTVRASVLLALQGPTVRLQFQSVAAQTQIATGMDRATAISASAMRDSAAQCVRLEFVTMWRA